jgi:hypothetical protein
MSVLGPLRQSLVGRKYRWWLALSIFAITSCSAASVDTQPTTETDAAAPTTGVSTTTTFASSFSESTLQVGLPRTSTYAFLDVTIVSATLGRIEPRTYMTEKWEQGENNFLFLELSVRNNSNTDTANWPPNPFSLDIAGDNSGPPEVLEGRPHIGLTALQTADMALAFPVPIGQGFDDLALILAEEDRIPMVLPLIGPVPDLGYPIEVDVEVDGHMEGGCGQDVEVKALGATSKVDLIDTPSPTSYGARRANLGERFLTVDLRIQNNGGQHCGGGSTNFGTDSVRLVVDGLSYAPVAGLNQSIAANSVAEMEFHFVYPIAAREIDLIIGDPAKLHLEAAVDVANAGVLQVEG